MPSSEAIAHTVNRYLELLTTGTADDIVNLYAADATIEDPIGSDILRGGDAIHKFYAAFQDAPKQTELVELRVGGSQAAFLWRLTLDAGEAKTQIAPISVMEFDEDAKVTAMRAFWSPTDVKVL
jgi:steroid Delta-isomerase